MNGPDYIRAHSQVLNSRATGLQSRLQELPVAAVLFDIYGTLMISASGDIGVASSLSRGDALACALNEVYGYTGASEQQQLIDLIAEDHQHMRDRGHPCPEVDIREIWQSLARSLSLNTDVEAASQAALIYECATNPVWPMQHLETCLQHLRDAGVHLGIISNAQFYTPMLFPALTERSLSDWGFNEQLCWYSYVHRRAKPDTWMYQQAADKLLAGYQVRPEQVLYIGNDMLNDMLPASQLGFRTALFAGDERSLRLRADHPQAGTVEVDCIMTDLQQITHMVTGTGGKVQA